MQIFLDSIYKEIFKIFKPYILPICLGIIVVFLILIICKIINNKFKKISK